MTGEHAPLAPSSAPIWGRCSGFVPVVTMYPGKWYARTDEGTAAHWVAAEVLQTWSSATDWNEPDCLPYLDEVAPNGVVIDHEIVEGAQVYVDDVVQTCKHYDIHPTHVGVEFRVSSPQIHEQNWGTLDAALYVPSRALMIIWDYKHGHRMVRAEGNYQLANYAAGLKHELQIDGHADQQIVLQFRVVQPYVYRPAGPVEVWEGLLSDLRAIWNILAAKAHEAFTDPKFSAGPHCRDCPHILNCPTAKGWFYAWADYLNEPFAVESMDSPALAVERSILETMLKAGQARLDALEDDLSERIRQGDQSSGLTLEASLGRLAWSAPPAQVRAFAQQFGADASKEDALQTPTQVLNSLPRQVREQFRTVLSQVATRPSGGIKLVPAAESRAAKAFQPPKTEER